MTETPLRALAERLAEQILTCVRLKPEADWHGVISGAIEAALRDASRASQPSPSLREALPCPHYNDGVCYAGTCACEGKPRTLATFQAALAGQEPSPSERS